jgi:hypothetical protein
MAKIDGNERSFSKLLEGLGEGAFHAETSETLHKLTETLFRHAVDFSKAKGTLTMTLSIEVDRDGVVSIDPDVKTKAPKPARTKGRYWLTATGDLARENPRQQKLPLREVSMPRTRDVDLPPDNAPRGV